MLATQLKQARMALVVYKSPVVSPTSDDVGVVRGMADVVNASTADDALCLLNCTLETLLRLLPT